MNKIKCPKCGEVFTIDEDSYANIVSQIKNDEFEKEISRREKELSEKNKLDIELAKTKVEQSSKDKIIELENKLKEKDSLLEKADVEKQLAIEKAINEKEKVILEKEKEITDLNGRLNNSAKDAEIKEQEIKNSFEQKLKEKETEVAYYKDLKTRLSTKLVGETLEQHCQILFDQIRMTAFPNAYFEKDNDVSKESRSKGDFIFKDFMEDGKTPFISIMFDMKNESDTTATKCKNEDFFKELDKDRNEKGCEYAVLVSMLESDNELYNAGIVDVSYRYPKMYVVRPQCFIPIISLLRNAALKTIDYQRQVIKYQAENIDVVNFENKLLDVQDKINKNYNLAKNHFESAINEIDKTINDLLKVKNSLLGATNQFRLANDKAQELSIKRLTKGNETMKKYFEDAKSLK